MSRQFTYHEATVLDFSLRGEEGYLLLECPTEADDAMVHVSITFKGVSDVRVDGVKKSNINRLMDDGEIIHFESKNKVCDVIIEWNDFARKKRLTVAYKFKFSEQTIRLGH